MKKFSVLFIVILIAIYIVINLLTLSKFPSVYRDDAWMSDPAWQFLKNGKFSASLFEGFYDLGKIDTYHGRIHSITLAVVFKLFGCGLYQARIVSFFSGLLAALFVYLIGKRLFNGKVGLIGAILFLFSKQFLINSHWARQDMMLTLFIVIAIYLYLLARDKNSMSLYFLCGLVAALSIDVHLNGVMLPIVIVALFLFDYRTKVLKQITLWLYMSGVGLGIFYWGILHIFPAPSIFFQQWNEYLKEFYPPIFLKKNLFELLIWDAERYIKYIRYIWRGEKYLNIFEILFVTIALIFGAQWKKRNKSTLLVIIFAFMFLFSILVVHKSSFYLVYLYPFFMLSIASFSYLSKNKFKIALGTIFIFTLGFFYVFQNGYRLYEFKENNYYKYMENLKNYIPSGCAIGGQPTWWFGFYNTNKYYAIASYEPEDGLSKFVKEKEIKYLLFDEYWKKHSTEEVKDFLKERCTLIARLKDKFYGAEAFLPHLSSFYILEIYKVKNE